MAPAKWSELLKSILDPLSCAKPRRDTVSWTFVLYVLILQLLTEVQWTKPVQSCCRLFSSGSEAGGITFVQTCGIFHNSNQSQSEAFSWHPFFSGMRKKPEWQNHEDSFGQHCKWNMFHCSFLFLCFSAIQGFLAKSRRKNYLVVYQRTEAPLFSRL